MESTDLAHGILTPAFDGHPRVRADLVAGGFWVDTWDDRDNRIANIAFALFTIQGKITTANTEEGRIYFFKGFSSLDAFIGLLRTSSRRDKGAGGIEWGAYARSSLVIASTP